MEVIQEARHAY